MEKESRENSSRDKKQANYTALIIGGSAVLLLLIAVSSTFLTQVRNEEDLGIAAHIEKLQQLFVAINESSQIVSIKGLHAPINFLNVKTFEGSFVGPLQLARPDRWQGPYLKEPFVAQEKEYQIISTQQGAYIVPGEGVKLANGKVIGSSLRFNESSDIEAMMKDPALLLSNSKPLAAKIPLTHKPVSFSRVVDFDQEDDLSTY